MARKGLTVDVETFFLAVCLKCGPPLQRYFDYMHPVLGWNGMRMEGINVWVHNTEEGRVYLDVVTGFGEAKLRATHWYLKYCHWYRKEMQKSERERRIRLLQGSNTVGEQQVLRAQAKWSHDTEERHRAREELKNISASRKSSRAKSKR